MSEESTEAAESAETAQGAVESEAPVSPPWGDDFNPERAWKTILSQRDRERELESEAKAWKRFREDEEFRREQLSELGYEFEEPPEEEDEDDEPQFLTRQEFEQREQQRQIAESNRMFAADLKELTSERPLPKQGQDWISALYERGKFKTATDVKAALDEWYAYEDSLKEDGKRSRPTSPTPPSPPQPGRAGEAEFDRRSATPAQRKANREARIAAQLAAADQQ